MSDPISLTGTAVGVVSLGLQVCSGIVSYCQAWRGFDEDIERFARKAEGLRIHLNMLDLNMLGALRETSPGMDVTTATDIEDKLRNIERVLTRLKTATKQLTSGGSGDTAAIRAQFKKATYPFRKNGLREMSSDLDSLQISLHTTLLAIMMQHAGTSLSIQQATAQNIQDMNMSIQGIQKQLMPPISSQNRCPTHDSEVATAPASSIIYTDSTTIIAGSQSRPYVNVKWKGTNKKKTYSHSSRLLNLAINFTLSVSSGTAGFQILPSLHLRFLQDANSSHAINILNSFAKYTWNKSEPDNFQKVVSATIIQLQEVFDRGDATPSDIFAYSSNQVSFSMLDYLCLNLSGKALLESERLLWFLIDCGSGPGPYHNYYTWSLCFSLKLGSLWARWYIIGSRLIDLYGYFIRPPRSLAEREGLRYIICQDHDNVAVPEIAKAIVLESEHDLIAAIAAKPSLVNERIGNYSLLEFAFCWPRGIQILLEAGADAHAFWINFVEDTKSKSVYDSVKLLLKAGCKFSFHHIEKCNGVENGDNMRDLFIRELITRLQGLWELAKCYLQPEESPTLFDQDKDSKNTVIFDIRTTQVYSKLSQQSITVDRSLQTPHDDMLGSIYHCGFFSARTLQKLYDFGFRGVNEPDLNGIFPLMVCGMEFYWTMGESNAWRVAEKLVWLISKGADLERLVPGTRSTVGHHLIYEIIYSFTFRVKLSHESPNTIQEAWRHYADTILKLGKSVTITPSAGDGCSCACSPSGCSAISLLLRQVTIYYFISVGYPKFIRGDFGFLFREMVPTFISWIGDNLKVYRAVIRFLTFGALGLRHVCCVQKGVRPLPCFKLQDRDRQEVEEILDEERLGLEDLETLVTEFEDKFDELGLPVMDFLQGFWYSRMISFLSERDPYDQEHVLESRKLGVELKAEDWVLPERVSLLIRPPVEEVES